jgi:hypothetical protein
MRIGSNIASNAMFNAKGYTALDGGFDAVE